MFQIEDGRSCFWQWDLNRRIIVNDDSITEVHYCNKTESCSLITEVYKENGISYSNVPNILLTTDWKINVYGYDKDYTKHSKCFKVQSRSKPADYIYTETEVKNYDALAARIKELEEKEVEVDLSNYYTKQETEYLMSCYAEIQYVDNLAGEIAEKATKEEVGNIEAALDAIIAIQNELIGG